MRVSWYNRSMETQAISLENLIATNQELLTKNETLTAENEQLRQRIQWFMEQIKLSQKNRYGSSSEQTFHDQESLFNEAEFTADLSAPEPKLTEVKAHTRKRTRLTTDKLPEGLPVEIVEHELPDEERVCPECGGEMHKMGTETIREDLKVIPAQMVIVKHVQAAYSCRCCEAESDHVPVIKAETPAPVISGGFAAPETVAHIATQKYMMASPLYRQEQEWRQNGILLSRQTMSNWLIKASENWLAPIYERMKVRLCEHTVAHADETVLQVLKEPGKAAQSQSRMWMYRTSGEAATQIVLYEYQPDRRYEHPREFLRNFSGYLHTDGYDGYHSLPDDIIVVGCWAHMRRKFFDAMTALSKDKQPGSTPAKGVEYCDKLFQLEKQFALLTSDERLKARASRSKPLVDEFYRWVGQLAALPKSLLGNAVNYAISQRKYLERYLLDGRLEISNNRAERTIKPFVIGRKNWLFANTPDGAKASAIYYSLIVTALENGMRPFEYLTWIFTNMPNLGRAGYVAAIKDFLPGNDNIPENIFVPASMRAKSGKYAWEES
jgi:transposase